jgi:hypothetical protein
MKDLVLQASKFFLGEKSSTGIAIYDFKTNNMLVSLLT